MFLNNFPTFKIYFHGIIAVFFSGMAWEISNFQIGFLKYIWFILLSLTTSSLEFFGNCFHSPAEFSQILATQPPRQGQVGGEVRLSDEYSGKFRRRMKTIVKCCLKMEEFKLENPRSKHSFFPCHTRTD